MTVSRKPFFTAETIDAFQVQHIDAKTGKSLGIGGESELLEVLNERVAPLLEELEKWKKWERGSTVMVPCKELTEMQEMMKALRAGLEDMRKVFQWIINSNPLPDLSRDKYEVAYRFVSAHCNDPIDSIDTLLNRDGRGK